MHADLSLMGRDQLQDCNINRVCVELQIRHAHPVSPVPETTAPALSKVGYTYINQGYWYLYQVDRGA